MKDIRTTCIKIKIKFKNSDKKRNKELEELIKFVDKSDLFKGKKRKIKSMIRGFKAK